MRLLILQLVAAVRALSTSQSRLQNALDHLDRNPSVDACLDVVRAMPHKLQRLVGYHTFGLGVDGRDPIDVLEDGIVVNPDAQPADYWRQRYSPSG